MDPSLPTTVFVLTPPALWIHVHFSSLRVNNLSKQHWMSFLDLMYASIRVNEQEIMHECVCINIRLLFCPSLTVWKGTVLLHLLCLQRCWYEACECLCKSVSDLFNKKWKKSTFQTWLKTLKIFELYIQDMWGKTMFKCFILTLKCNYIHTQTNQIKVWFMLKWEKKQVKSESKNT